MEQDAAMHVLAGRWTGTNQLWLPPATTPYDSTSTATIASVVAHKFIQINYTWVFEDAPQEGMLLVGTETATNKATVVFVDSWHMGEAVMVCTGLYEADGTVNVRGSYGVEGSEDWGWRIVLEPGPDTFRLAMFNIDPAQEEMLAVEVHYVRSHE